MRKDWLKGLDKQKEACVLPDSKQCEVNACFCAIQQAQKNMCCLANSANFQIENCYSGTLYTENFYYLYGNLARCDLKRVNKYFRRAFKKAGFIKVLGAIDIQATVYVETQQTLFKLHFHGLFETIQTKDQINKKLGQWFQITEYAPQPTSFKDIKTNEYNAGYGLKLDDQLGVSISKNDVVFKGNYPYMRGSLQREAVAWLAQYSITDRIIYYQAHM